MTAKSKDLAKTETARHLTPFEDIETWFDWAWSRPFSLFGSPLVPRTWIEESTISPSVDIYEEGNDLVLKADVPGVDKEHLDVNIHENILTITGEKKKEEKVEKEDYFRYERSHGSFSRRFEVPSGINTEKIKATFKDGVLEVRMPKTEEAKTRTRKIDVK